MSSKPGNPRTQERSYSRLPTGKGNLYSSNGPPSHVATTRVEMLTHHVVSLLVGSVREKTNLLDQQSNTGNNHIHQN